MSTHTATEPAASRTRSEHYVWRVRLLVSARAGHCARGRRVGDRPAVPRHAAAPARPGLLVAVRPAAAARRPRRRALPRVRRAPADRGPGGDDAARRTRPLDVRDGVSAARPVPARGGDRRRGGVAAARVAAVSVAVVPVPDGRAHVARHDVLHELDDSHGRPRFVGAGDDVRRRRRARPREREAAQPALAARDALRVPRLGRGVPRARAEPVVLPALVVPASPPRVDDGRSAPCSRSRGLWRPNWAVANAGIAIVFVFVSLALFSDRDLAPVFGHLSPLAGEPHR